MATATTRRAGPDAAALKKRRDAAKKRLDLEITLAKPYARMAELDAQLKDMADAAGGSFKEDFGALGYVSASGPHGAEFKGEVPVIVTEAWEKLSAAKREQLLASGLVAIERQFSKAFNGRVTAKAL